MKKLMITLLALIAVNFVTNAQQLTQTVRGTILDADSKMPLIGATVKVLDSNPLIGTTADLDGNFRLEKIPVGRISLEISFMGYESKIVPNVVVNSGKEVILNLALRESLVSLEEVLVKANKKNGEALNEMSLLSARSVSSEQTARYAGTFNDPSRIMSNYAGVTSTQDGSNDIIVRGNSPKYIQWRLEGVEITNPNHFEDQNSASGAMCALNNNLLATSDFYTGAFAPEFGDALSGVYDVKMRPGNNEKFESTFGFGILGTDFTVEGPFKKGYAGSYILNYRYSTISLVNDIGLADLDGILNFQDAAFKVVLPTKKTGTFSLFGLGGLSGFNLDDINPSVWQTPGDRAMHTEIVEDYSKDNYLLNTGLNHTFSLNRNSYLKTTLAYSGNGIKDNIYESKISRFFDDQGGIKYDTIDRKLNYRSRINSSAYRGSLTYNNKLSAKSQIQIGTKYSLSEFDNDQSMLIDSANERKTLVGFTGKVGTLRNYISWKFRVSENITLVSGLHNMNVLLNSKSTIEPRFALKWNFNNTCAISLGYGNHSNMERIHNYYTQITDENGIVNEPNKDLDLLKAHHYVVGIERQVSENVKAKIELYYQDLYSLPVENNDTSHYATINEGLDFRYVDLVNKGTGKNYGIELTLERYFVSNFYYLFNASVYESKYKSLEGVERNTQFNGNYLMNFLCGREFDKLGKKKNQTLALNAKMFYGGGRKIIPLLRDGNGNLAVDPENNKYWDYKKAYENKIEDAYQIILSASYKFNKPKATHEIFINFENVTNNKAKITEYYDENEPDEVGNMTMFGFFPNLMYKVYF